MSERSTIEFKTTGGRVVVLREYITGEENWAIRQIYIRGMKAGAKDEDTTSFDAEKKAFEIVVVSVDGHTENIADTVIKLPLSEYREVAEQVTPIIEAKKKSETS